MQPQIPIEFIKSRKAFHFDAWMKALHRGTSGDSEYHWSQFKRYATAYGKEAAMPEPEPAPIEAPEVGEPLVCRQCGDATEGDTPAWSPLCVFPQGRWELRAGAWLHHCSYGQTGRAVNPWKSEAER